MANEVTPSSAVPSTPRKKRAPKAPKAAAVQPVVAAQPTTNCCCGSQAPAAPVSATPAVTPAVEQPKA